MEWGKDTLSHLHPDPLLVELYLYGNKSKSFQHNSYRVTRYPIPAANNKYIGTKLVVFLLLHDLCHMLV